MLITTNNLFIMVRNRAEHIRIFKDRMATFKTWLDLDWERDKEEFTFMMLLLFVSCIPLIGVIIGITIQN